MRARTRFPSRTGSSPSTVSRPLVGALTACTMRMVDVLPAPFGPRKPKHLPLSMRNEIPETASTSPKRFRRSLASIATSMKRSAFLSVRGPDPEDALDCAHLGLARETAASRPAQDREQLRFGFVRRFEQVLALQD